MGNNEGLVLVLRSQSKGETGEGLGQTVKPQGYCRVWLCPVNSEELASWIPEDRRGVGVLEPPSYTIGSVLNGWDGLTEENTNFWKIANDFLCFV